VRDAAFGRYRQAGRKGYRQGGVFAGRREVTA
jgi:hypothetical protein